MESSFLCLEWELWAGEMTLWVKRLALNPDCWSSALGTHMVEKRAGSYKLSSDLHVCHGIYMCAYM